MKINIDQITTFYVGKELVGIPVLEVQEVATPGEIHQVPLTPDFITGLINLRGQIATAVDLRTLFKTKPESDSTMSVVCKIDGNLASLIVDQIGDVVNVENLNMESVPSTVPDSIRKYLNGIFKTDGRFISILNLESLSQELNPSNEQLTGLAVN